MELYVYYYPYCWVSTRTGGELDDNIEAVVERVA
jgi:hypothetical protein